MESGAKDGVGGGGAAASPGVGKVAGSDPQLVEAATKFVSDVIEKAKEEASRRRAQQRREAGSKAGADTGAEARKATRGIGGPIPWHSRARGLLTRLLSSFCFRGATTTTTRSEIPKTS